MWPDLKQIKINEERRIAEDMNELVSNDDNDSLMCFQMGRHKLMILLSGILKPRYFDYYT